MILKSEFMFKDLILDELNNVWCEILIKRSKF
jgi:hypothetical protein